MDEIIEFEDHEISTKTLFEYCNSKYTFSDPASIRIAVNQQLDYQNSIVHGDELALLPPFAGG
jgi:molybdopterin converting factor small subunit